METYKHLSIKERELIYNNLDLHNYLIKYAVFRNSTFIINFLTVVEEDGLSEVMKKKRSSRFR